MTSRAAFLALLVCCMVLALTVPLRQFFAQRERLDAAQARHAAQAARVAALEAQKERLADPAYVERLARERLRYVRPGEVPFIVLTPSAAPSPGTRRAAGSPPDPAPKRAWYSQLWSSVEAAGATHSPSPTGPRDP
ncbi:MAG TPA: septum formation initiator family protein [Mycobacteriales bacterium]|nr:septum formation initiator family protein [Mycobacteriales bacterium]